MQQLPDNIVEFLEENHVISLATQDAEGLWAASCFYVYNPENISLIVMSALKTRHGAAMQGADLIAGSIAGQPSAIPDIRGIQLTARPRLIDGAERKAALKLYVKRHTAAKFFQTDTWALDLVHMKFTSNKIVFAQKTLWDREAPAAE